jgi:hypothetical protein
MSNIVGVETICRDCVFAKYAENVQVGCSLGKIDRFAKQGIVEECVDEYGKEFYLLQNTICISWRSPDWAIGKEDITEAIKKEQSPKYAWLVFCNDGKLETVQRACESIQKQTTNPAHIAIVFEYGVVYDIYEMYKYLSKNVSNWIIHSVTDNEIIKDAVIDSIVLSLNIDYILCTSTDIPEGLMDRINEMIYMDQKLIGQFDGDNFTLINNVIRKYYQGGSFETPLKDKILAGKHSCLYEKV